MMKHPFNRMTDDQKLSAFRVMLSSAASAVFLGGAGVSTESGIPDFRSKDGLYHYIGHSLNPCINALTAVPDHGCVIPERAGSLS